MLFIMHSFASPSFSAKMPSMALAMLGNVNWLCLFLQEVLMTRAKTPLKMEDRRSILRIPQGFGKERRALKIQTHLQKVTLERITLMTSIQYVLALTSLLIISHLLCLSPCSYLTQRRFLGHVGLLLLDSQDGLLFVHFRFTKLDKKMYVKPGMDKPFVRLSPWIGHLQLCKVINQNSRH
jgi:hypothetical protein